MSEPARSQAPSGGWSKGPALWLGTLVAALEFFTRIPRPQGVVYMPEHARLAPALAPLVGWLVGVSSALVLVAAHSVLPASVAAVLAVGAVVLLTGALHEDGLADVCDAMGAMDQRERALAIMKDSRSGAYAIVGVVLSQLARVGLLSALVASLDATVLLLSLVSAHASSRLAGLMLSMSLDYARPAGDARAADFVTRPPWWLVGVGAAAGVIPLLALAVSEGIQVLLALPAVALVWLGLRAQFSRRFGGWTGDCVGCTQQLTELACLAAICAVLVGNG